MARITRPPQFSFDDSLVLLNRRQDPLTQTQRGNYEWTWAQARCYQNTAEGVPPFYEEETLEISASDVFTLLMFGADVPQLAYYIAEEAGQGAYTDALFIYFAAVRTWIQGINAWGATVTPPLPAVEVPANPQALPVLCVTRASQLVRPPTLTPDWGTIVDAGQGALVSCTYANAGGVQTFAQGFPLLIDDLICTSGPVTAFVEHLTITVGYESQLNHGIALAKSTGGEGVNAQPAYTPIILRREDYSPEISTAGNVIQQGNETLIVVGLWDKYVGGV